MNGQEEDRNQDRLEQMRQYRYVRRLALGRDLLEGLRNNTVKNLFHGDHLDQQQRIFKLFSSEDSGLDMDDFLQAADENTSAKSIRLEAPFQPNQIGYDNPGQWRRRWVEFARGIGSLQGLREMVLVQGRNGSVGVNDDGDIISADIDMALTGLAVKHAYQVETLKIKFCISIDDDCEPFALALQAHPSLRCIEFHGRTDQTPVDAISRQLGGIPKLSSVKFASLGSRGVQFRTLPDSFFKHLESVTNLKELSLRQCVITQRQCELLSCSLVSLKIQKLDLCDSMFLGSGGLVLAKALQRTANLEEFSISPLGLNSLSLCEELSQAFLNNTKLRVIAIQSVSEGLSDANIFSGFEPSWFVPFFRVMGKLPDLQEVHVCDLDRWTNDVADEFRALMELPTSDVQTLKVFSYGLASTWCRIEPFLLVNTALRSLTLSNCINCVGANKLASLLKSNKYLETLEIHAIDGKHSSDYLYNYHRWLEDQGFTSMPNVDKDWFRQWCNFHTPEGNYMCKGQMLCNVNKAERRYVARVRADKSTGVKVLSLVVDNVDFVYDHLRENPTLCELRDPSIIESSSSCDKGRLISKKRKLNGAFQDQKAIRTQDW